MSVKLNDSKLPFSIMSVRERNPTLCKFIRVRQSNSNHVVPKMSPSGPISNKCVTLFWNVISPRTNQRNSKCHTAAARCIILQVLSKWDQSSLMFCVWHVNEQTDVARLVLGLICVILKTRQKKQNTHTAVSFIILHKFFDRIQQVQNCGVPLTGREESSVNLESYLHLLKLLSFRHLSNVPQLYGAY